MNNEEVKTTMEVKMNNEEAERYLPCYKMEVIQTADDEGLYKFYCASTVEELLSNKYHPIWYRSFESFDDAYLSAINVMMEYSARDVEEESYMPFDEGDEYLSKVVEKHKIIVTEKIEEFDSGFMRFSGKTLCETGNVDIEVFTNNQEFYRKESIKYCPFYIIRDFSKAYVLMSEMIND